MSALHVRYLGLAVLTAMLTGFAVALFFFTLLREAAGLAVVAGALTALFSVAALALSAGRKSVTAYKIEEPRLGAVAGTWMGVWVGLGGLLGLWLLGQFLGWFYNIAGLPARINSGLLVALGIVTFFCCIIAARIAARESAHPPEDEEAA